MVQIPRHSSQVDQEESFQVKVPLILLLIFRYWIAVYIVIWSTFGTAFEWLSSYFKVFIYKGWKPTYSFTFYLFIQSLTLLFFKYVTFIHQNTPKNN